MYATTASGMATVEGWEALEKLVAEREDELTYLAVHQYGAGERTELIAKVVVEGDGATDLTRWLAPEAVVPDAPVARADLVEAALTCARDAVIANPGSGDRTRFRVQLYGPKGTYLASRSVTLYLEPWSGAAPASAPAAALTLPEGLNPDDLVTLRLTAGLNALFEKVDRFCNMMVTHTGQIIGISSRQLNQSAQQLEAFSIRNDRLVTALTEQRRITALTTSETSSAAAAERSRTEIGKQAVDGIKQVLTTLMLKDQDPRLRAFATDERLQELAGLVAADPELRDLLSDPAMVGALRNPEFRQGAVGVLSQIRAAAAQEVAARAAQARAGAPASPQQSAA
jgi:hypothetical protein